MIYFPKSIFLIVASLNLILGAVDFSLISTKIPDATGHMFLNKTLYVNGFQDFGFKEVELVDKCLGQAENQKTVIRVSDGGHVKNLILGKNAGNGIVCDGDCTLENVHWRDVCEVVF